MLSSTNLKIAGILISSFWVIQLYLKIKPETLQKDNMLKEMDQAIEFNLRSSLLKQ